MIPSMSPFLIRQYAAVFIVNLNIFTAGMSMGWPSPALVKLRDSQQTQLTVPITEEQGSWMVSLGFLGGAFVDVIAGLLINLLGSKKSLILASLSRIAMGFLCIFADEAWILIAARTIMLSNDCFLYVIVPVYASEIADKNQRGVLGSFLQVFSSLGTVVTLTVGPFTSYKTFNIMFTSLIIITSLPILWLPDSPYYLYKKGYMTKVFKILKSIRNSDTLVKQEIEDYRISLERINENTGKIKLFKNKLFLKSLSLGILLGIGSQLVGFNAVLFYLQTILESTHTYVKPEIASSIIGIIQFVGAFFTMLITSRFGRRTILLTFLCGVFLGMVGLGIFFKVSEARGYKILGFMNYMPIISIILVVFSYSVGIGSLLWLIIPELFDNSHRAVGTSASFFSITASIFVTTKYFPFMTVSLGPAITYWFFATMTAILIILLALFLPETKDKSFNEIQIALTDLRQDSRL